MSDADGSHVGPPNSLTREDGERVEALKIKLDAPDDFDGWREAARGLVMAGVPPTGVVWQVEGDDGELFGSTGVAPPATGGQPMFSVPKPFVDLAQAAICHSDPQRLALLYARLWEPCGGGAAS